MQKFLHKSNDICSSLFIVVVFVVIVVFIVVVVVVFVAVAVVFAVLAGAIESMRH